MFKDREQAGKLLAKKLRKFSNEKDVLIFGITRGGVVVADQVAQRLSLPLDIIVVKKIGAPLNPELAIGAVGPKEAVFWERELIKQLHIGKLYLKKALSEKKVERQRLEEYLKGNPPSPSRRQGYGRQARLRGASIQNKIAILVDDGVATGATVLAALEFFRSKKVKEIILAAPIIAKDTYDYIVKFFDSIVVLMIPNELNSIGQFYGNFDQVENKEVKKIIDKH